MKKATKVLVVAGLANAMIDSFLSPISSIENVQVSVLRSTPGPQREGVSYISPPRAFQRSGFVTLLWKIWHSILLGLRGDFSCVYAILVFPHLYLASLISFLAKKPLVYQMVASEFEFFGKGAVLQALTPKLAKRSSVVLAPNKRTYKYLKRRFPTEKIGMLRLLDLVPTDSFFPLKLEKPIDLVVVSRLSPEKNVNLFVDIVGLLKVEIPGVKAAIVGDGPLRKKLHEQVLQKGLSENIKFYGWMSSLTSLNRILNSSKIFVLNSSHEGGPFTVIEAMAAGLCCVSSKVGHVPDVVVHNRNGYIVEEYDDIDTYVKMILELLCDSERLARIQKEALRIKALQMPNRPIRFWRELTSRIV